MFSEPVASFQVHQQKVFWKENQDLPSPITRTNSTVHKCGLSFPLSCKHYGGTNLSGILEQLQAAQRQLASAETAVSFYQRNTVTKVAPSPQFAPARQAKPPLLRELTPQTNLNKPPPNWLRANRQVNAITRPDPPVHYTFSKSKFIHLWSSWCYSMRGFWTTNSWLHQFLQLYFRHRPGSCQIQQQRASKQCIGSYSESQESRRWLWCYCPSRESKKVI